MTTERSTKTDPKPVLPLVLGGLACALSVWAVHDAGAARRENEQLSRECQELDRKIQHSIAYTTALKKRVEADQSNPTDTVSVE